MYNVSSLLISFNYTGELSTKMMHFKDQRVKLMSEILYGIRVLKFHAWESFFERKVNGISIKIMRCGCIYY